LVQNIISEDFTLEDFWFRRESFDSRASFGATPSKVRFAPEVGDKKGGSLLCKGVDSAASFRLHPNEGSDKRGT
jgi:hypothetical protein